MPYSAPSARQTALEKMSARRKLLRRYVDLAFAQEDQIMQSTKVGTAVGFGVADFFTFGLTTVIGKNIEAPVIASVRGVRRVQSSQMYTAINALPAERLRLLAAEAMLKQEPGFDWLREQLNSSANGAAAAAAGAQAVVSSMAGGSSGGGSSMAGDIAQEVFTDYISDAVFDQLASCIPFGIGAAKAGVQVAQVTQRISDLRARIVILKSQAA